MKKRILAVLLICIIALTGNQSFAAANEITPYFNVVSAVTSTITGGVNAINSNIRVLAPSSTSLDKVYAEVKVKRISGVVVKTYGKYMDKSIATFTFSESTPVNSRGTYYFEYTLRCYKDNVVVDTITGTSRSLTYEP